ncbi:MAG TPA: DUF5946 family protein [Pyrinomonadaceae bacterium]|nr:DUF5946 family protein [Pyrinomonadaceae bacterium]
MASIRAMMTASGNKNSDDVCEDCRAVVLQGSVGCLKLFEDILAREFSDYRYGKIHRLTVDAYSLQHPDKYMRSGKSFAAHLTGMCAAVEYEDALTLNQMVQKWLSRNPQIDKPVHLPEHRGDLTITYILSASDADEHIKRVREWAQDIWSAWFEHHGLATQLIDRARAEINKS